MSRLSYAEQLKHPFWQRKRLEVLDAANFACERCGAAESTLHVHHKRYRRGRMAWQYPRSDFEALCEKCHSIEHNITVPVPAPQMVAPSPGRIELMKVENDLRLLFAKVVLTPEEQDVGCALMAEQMRLKHVLIAGNA